MAKNATAWRNLAGAQGRPRWKSREEEDGTEELISTPITAEQGEGVGVTEVARSGGLGSQSMAPSSLAVTSDDVFRQEVQEALGLAAFQPEAGDVEQPILWAPVASPADMLGAAAASRSEVETDLWQILAAEETASVTEPAANGSRGDLRMESFARSGSSPQARRPADPAVAVRRSYRVEDLWELSALADLMTDDICKSLRAFGSRTASTNSMRCAPAGDFSPLPPPPIPAIEPSEDLQRSVWQLWQVQQKLLEEASLQSLRLVTAEEEATFWKAECQKLEGEADEARRQPLQAPVGGRISADSPQAPGAVAANVGRSQDAFLAALTTREVGTVTPMSAKMSELAALREQMQYLVDAQGAAAAGPHAAMPRGAPAACHGAPVATAPVLSRQVAPAAPADSFTTAQAPSRPVGAHAFGDAGDYPCSSGVDVDRVGSPDAGSMGAAHVVDTMRQVSKAKLEAIKKRHMQWDAMAHM
eukprot:gnl/TRDRNA2_/TRDRNA2_135487_c0_seq1.p1 gnl/TRDRNA2_/TRDRNA2_135487_c0~~gnl/TRDRNA2_/TRDRNA2_135487_c0_seq1.p1  ORF type:complete len:474 (+),score=97.46 gnl/TRDRNA2_/TRDRNA2_135487_c0_seq1:2-1423(+)